MEQLFLLSLIAASCGLVLMLAKNVLTIVINHKTLNDIYLCRPLRYKYEVSNLKDITEMSVYLNFVKDYGNKYIWDLIRRKNFLSEKTLYITGNVLEILGCYGIMKTCGILALDSIMLKNILLHTILLLIGSWFIIYYINLALECVFGLFASKHYKNIVNRYEQ